MNLMKQAVEVRREWRAEGSGWEARWHLIHTPSLALSIPQIYVHHDIYDLIFKYVGTMEASEVSLPSLFSRMSALS